MPLRVGLDLSLVSPGIATFETLSGRWTLYGFAQRVREKGFRRQHGETVICLLPAIPNLPSTTNEERYEHIRFHIVETILSPFLLEKEAVIGIEGYAFGARQSSGSSYKLQELGGIIKHSLWTRYPQWRQEVLPPTHWKKDTLGRGRATKSEVIEYVRTHGPEVPIMGLLGLEVSKQGEIPCPAQDLADAVCICLSVYSKKRPRSTSHESILN